MIKEEFDEKLGKFEDVLQKIANDVANGTLFEKLPPSELFEKTEKHVDQLRDLTTRCEELLLTLKPEKAHAVKTACKNLAQTLATYKEILLQNSSEPLANSRLAFEQLRKAIADSSDFLLLAREIRENPSPLISAILAFKKASESKSSVINIQAKEDIQPLIKYILDHIDKLRADLIGVEKKVNEMKLTMRELQEESLKILSNKTSQPKPTENKVEKKQLSLSNFKNEKN